MPEAQAAAPAARVRQEEDNGFRRAFGIIQQIILVYLASQLIGKFFAPSAPNQAAPPTASPGIPSTTPGDPNALSIPPKVAELSPVFPLGTLIDVHFCLSMSPHGDTCVKGARSRGALPTFKWENITFGDWKESRMMDLNVKLPPAVLRNTSLWADVLITHAGASPDPRDESFNRPKTVHLRKLMTRYFPKAKERKVKNLLSNKAGAEAEIEEPDVIVGHWHKNMTIALVSDATQVALDKLPAPIAPYITLEPVMRDPTGTIGYYKPILFPNEFWHLKEQYLEINSSTPEFPLRIVFQPMSYFKFQMFSTLTASFEQVAQQQGSSSGGELDEIKRMLTETNPWFLALTAAVSVLHMIFEMLAFTSDVSHWRNKQELVGVSVRTIVTNVFVQIVVLLYLLDNNENTSWMIIFTSGMGVLVEAWKVTKAVNINLIPAPAGSTLPYKIQITDKHVLSEDEKKTQEYDKLAFRYVTYVTIPLLGAYTIYSLLYESHRGWYSFVISTLTSFVYMFGFAQLIPQLIINYKLKSVAHMPMKAMVYKTLSTVVDDFFAFCIKMPILHRLACFRDDVVFCVFLYQRWIYRIDPKRVNEYGQVMASDIDAAASQEKKNPQDKVKLATKAREKAE